MLPALAPPWVGDMKNTVVYGSKSQRYSERLHLQGGIGGIARRPRSRSSFTGYRTTARRESVQGFLPTLGELRTSAT